MCLSLEVYIITSLKIYHNRKFTHQILTLADIGTSFVFVQLTSLAYVHTSYKVIKNWFNTLLGQRYMPNIYHNIGLNM